MASNSTIRRKMLRKRRRKRSKSGTKKSLGLNKLFNALNIFTKKRRKSSKQKVQRGGE